MILPLGFFGMNIGPTELLVVLGIVLVLFGGEKLPSLARSLGRSMGEFKKGISDGEMLTDEKAKEIAAETEKDKPSQIEG